MFLSAILSENDFIVIYHEFALSSNILTTLHNICCLPPIPGDTERNPSHVSAERSPAQAGLVLHQK